MNGITRRGIPSSTVPRGIPLCYFSFDCNFCLWLCGGFSAWIFYDWFQSQLRCTLWFVGVRGYHHVSRRGSDSDSITLNLDLAVGSLRYFVEGFGGINTRKRSLQKIILSYCCLRPKYFRYGHPNCCSGKIFRKKIAIWVLITEILFHLKSQFFTITTYDFCIIKK